MAGNRSAIENISQHHAFLYGPGVVTVHKANQAIVAVFCGMFSIHRFAFDEQGVELGQTEVGLEVVGTQLETEVRRLGAAGAVVAGYFALSDDRVVGASTEAAHFAGLTQIVLDDGS